MKVRLLKILIILILVGNISKTDYVRKGNEIYYYESDIQNKGVKIENIDISTVQIIDESYLRDKNFVYEYGKKLDGIDAKSFQIVGDYIKDKNGVYDRDDDEKLVKLDGIDGNTFELLEERMYYRDKNFVYSYNISLGTLTKVEGMKASEFEIIDKENPRYVKDRNNFFYKENKFEDLDKSSFEIINWSYSKDKNNFYYEGKKINGVDKNSFEIVDDYIDFSKDKNNVYLKEKKLEGVTSEKFEIIQEIGDYYIYFKDKNNIYCLSFIEEDEKGNKKFSAIKGIDVNTFEFIAITSFIEVGKDKNGFYILQRPIDGSYEKLDSIDLKMISDRYFKDKNNAYYIEYDVSKGIKFQIIEGVDVKSFEGIPEKGYRNEEFSSIYAKDKNNIYYSGKKLKNIDVKTFEEVGGRVIKDKNGTYVFDKDENTILVNNKEIDKENLSYIGENLYMDLKNVYFLKDNKLEKINGGEKIKITQFFQDRFYFKGDNEVYYFDIDKNKLKKIENVDIDTFEIFNEEYTKDKNNVYFKGEVLKGADAKSFEDDYDKNGNIILKDKNKIYLKSENK